MFTAYMNSECAWFHWALVWVIGVNEMPHSVGLKHKSPITYIVIVSNSYTFLIIVTYKSTFAIHHSC